MNHLVAVEIKIEGAIVKNKITVTKEKFIDDDGHGVYRYILIYEGNLPQGVPWKQTSTSWCHIFDHRSTVIKLSI